MTLINLAVVELLNSKEELFVSISLWMIPIALAVRVVMGAENFDKWVKSMEVRMPTKFQSEHELANALELAGYDFIDYQKFKKTHFGKTFFFWEKNNDVWEAVFSTSDDKIVITELIEKIETVVGSKVFDKEIITKSPQSKEKSVQRVIYPTNFADSAMLKNTLTNYGISCVEKSTLDSEIFECDINNIKLILSKKTDEQVYYAEIIHTGNLSSAYFHLNNLDEEYKKNIQTATYKKVLSKVRQSNNMYIEDEHILEDNTLVITVGIR